MRCRPAIAGVLQSATLGGAELPQLLADRFASLLEDADDRLLLLFTGQIRSDLLRVPDVTRFVGGLLVRLELRDLCIQLTKLLAQLFWRGVACHSPSSRRSRRARASARW